MPKHDDSILRYFFHQNRERGKGQLVRVVLRFRVTKVYSFDRSTRDPLCAMVRSINTRTIRGRIPNWCFVLVTVLADSLTQSSSSEHMETA